MSRNDATTGTEPYEALLRRRLRELTERLETVEHDLDAPSDPDAEERAVEREGDEVLESLGTAGLAEIARIHAALRRIEAGTFGLCVVCGEPIARRRLDAVPHAARCRDCA